RGSRVGVGDRTAVCSREFQRHERLTKSTVKDKSIRLLSCDSLRLVVRTNKRGIDLAGGGSERILICSRAGRGEGGVGWGELYMPSDVSTSQLRRRAGLSEPRTHEGRLRIPLRPQPAWKPYLDIYLARTLGIEVDNRRFALHHCRTQSKLILTA